MSYANSPSTSLVEELIQPKYQLIDKIGEGTYGTVYKAINTELDQQVAIKKLNHFSNYGLRFLIEPYLMSTFRHPCLLDCEEILTHESFTCLVMQLGKDDLCNYLRSHPSTVSFEQKITWAWQLCQGIACLHQNNIIHGDIKPSNCMIMKDLSLRLGDFNMSVLTFPNQTYSHTVCTFSHRPPEVFLTHSWDSSIDTWGLGCTIYELMYGKLLFPYQGDVDAMHRDDELVISKMLLSQRDWSVSTGQTSNMFPHIKKSIKYIQPSRLKLEPEYTEINDLIVKLTQVDPKQRISIYQALNHSVFKQNKVLHTCIIAMPDTMSVEAVIIPMELQDVYPSKLSHFIKYLYQLINLGGVRVQNNLLLWWVCMFMTCKMTHMKLLQTPPFQWTEIIQLEQQISKQLNWRIPCVIT